MYSTFLCLLVLTIPQSHGVKPPFEFYPKGDLLLLYYQQFVAISKSTKAIQMNTQDDSNLRFDIVKPTLASKPAALVFQGDKFFDDLSISLEFRTISKGYLLSVIEPDSSTIFFGVSVNTRQNVAAEYPMTLLEVTYMQKNHNTGKRSQKILSAIMPLRVVRQLRTQKDYVLKFNVHVTNTSIFIYSGCGSENYPIQEVITPEDYSIATEFPPGSKVFLFSAGSINEGYYTGLIQNMRLFGNRSNIEKYCFSTVEGSGGEYMDRLRENFDEGSDGNIFVSTSKPPTTTAAPTTTILSTTQNIPVQNGGRTFTEESLSSCKKNCMSEKCKVMNFDTKLKQCSCSECETDENGTNMGYGVQAINKSAIENIIMETLTKREVIESLRGPKGDPGMCTCQYNISKEDTKKEDVKLREYTTSASDTTFRKTTLTSEYEATKPPTERRKLLKGTLNQGALVMSSSAEMEELSFLLPAGSFVLVLDEENGDKSKLIVKLSETTNTWREINMNIGQTLQFPLKNPSTTETKMEIKKHLVVESFKKLYMVLINYAWRGKMRMTEIHLKCQMEARQNGLPGIFLPFLGFENNKMEELVQPELRSSYPIVNINNETLFYSWDAIFRGSLINDQVSFLTFDRRDILRTDTWRSKFLWIGRGLRNLEATFPPTCLEWTTSNPLESGLAVNLKKKEFLGSVEAKSCGTANYVACIQSTLF